MTFLSEWLKPFIDLERENARLEELHYIQRVGVSARERQIAEKRAELIHECQKKVNGNVPEV